MRKIFFVIIAPLLTIAIVLATGFSIWYFGDKVITHDSTIHNGRVEPDCSIGELYINDSPNYQLFNVTMNPPSTDGGLDGITIDRDLVIKYVPASAHTGRIKFKCTILFPTVVYQTGNPNPAFPVPYMEVITNDPNFTFTANQTTANEMVYVYEFEFANNEYSSTNPFIRTIKKDIFKWHSYFIPASNDNYNDLKELFRTKKVTINVSVNYI